MMSKVKDVQREFELGRVCSCYWERAWTNDDVMVVWVSRGPPFTHPPEPVDNDTRQDSHTWLLRISIPSPPSPDTTHQHSRPARPLSIAYTRLSARLREKSHLPQTLVASATRRRTHAASCLQQKPPVPVHRRPARAVWVPCFNHHSLIVAMCAPPVQTTSASQPRMIHTTLSQIAIHERTGVRPRRL